MSGRVVAQEQPKSFAFTPENLKKAKAIIAKYPKGREQSAMLPLLDLAQRQNDNWVSIAAMNTIADLINVPYIRVYEVATFYTMFNLAPVGKYLVQVCRTTPCWLRGSDKITKTCKKKLGIEMNETTADGKFTLVEVECMGACVNAPMVQINDDYYEDLDEKNMETLLSQLAAGKKVTVGSQIGRQTSAPEGYKGKGATPAKTSAKSSFDASSKDATKKVKVGMTPPRNEVTQPTSKTKGSTKSSPKGKK
ncbi:MAG: NADH-quinone oxidoreductase subunit NuoE [Proteobacteria bacterium]|nr:NADH-quinone oxidoreductase subunit NuoE [Pseudomonadota bacterium]